MIDDSLSRRTVRAVIAAALAAFAALHADASFAAGSDMANAFAQLGRGAKETRTVTLKQLGLVENVTLYAPETRREFFLPVPADVPITDATLQFDGGYVRGDGGRTTMLLSIDGSPVLARSFTQDAGAVTVSLGVDGAPRPVGFVRIGVGYASAIVDTACADQTAIGNALRVDPTTRLTYRFDPADIHDLRTAWSALPYAPVLTIASRRLTAASLDTAWRTNALLQRDGKRPLTQALPAVGDSVDLAGADVPAGLRGVAAFDALALAGAGRHTLANAAELGALIVLAPRAAFGPDVLVADDGMRRSINGALDALRLQLAAAGGETLNAFDAWRSRAVAQAVAPLAPGEARVAQLGGRAVIVVGDNRGVAVLGQRWRPIDVANRVVVHEIQPGARVQDDLIPLSALGGEPGRSDVHTAASWEAASPHRRARGWPRAGGSRAGPRRLADARERRRDRDRLSERRDDRREGARRRRFAPASHPADSALRARPHERPARDVPPPAGRGLRDAPVVSGRRAADEPPDARQGHAAQHVRRDGGALCDVGDGDRPARLSRRRSAERAAPRNARGAAGIAPLEAKFVVTPDGARAEPDGPFLAADVALADEKNPAAFSPTA